MRLTRLEPSGPGPDPGLVERWARAACLSPGVATVGSSPEWGLAAWRHLAGGLGAKGLPGATAWVAEEGDHVAALAISPFAEIGPFLTPLESGWGFACPVVGPDLDGAGWRLLRDLLGEVAEPGMGVALLGLPRGTRLAASVLGWLRSRSGRAVVALETHDEVVADLSRGVEAWWDSRPPRFRAERRRLARRAAQKGVTVAVEGGRPMDEAESLALFARVKAAEARTWKAEGGESPLADPAHEAFYRELALAAGRRGGTWAAFAVDPELGDIGYAFGVSLGAVFRGLQLGYDERRASLGPAHLAQEALLRTLATRGITSYNLGMDLAYKRLWGEPAVRLAAWAGL